MAQLKTIVILAILVASAVLQGCAGLPGMGSGNTQSFTTRCTPAPQIMGQPARCWETPNQGFVIPAGTQVGARFSTTVGGVPHQCDWKEAALKGAGIGGIAGLITSLIAKDHKVLRDTAVGAVAGAGANVAIDQFTCTPTQQVTVQQNGQQVVVQQGQSPNGQKLTGVRSVELPAGEFKLHPNLKGLWVWKHPEGTNANPKDCAFERQIQETERPAFCSYVHTVPRQGTFPQWLDKAGMLVYSKTR